MSASAFNLFSVCLGFTLGSLKGQEELRNVEQGTILIINDFF